MCTVTCTACCATAAARLPRTGQRDDLLVVEAHAVEHVAQMVAGTLGGRGPRRAARRQVALWRAALRVLCVLPPKLQRDLRAARDLRGAHSPRVARLQLSTG